jgi:phospholipid transport system substrate-binding protein
MTRHPFTAALALAALSCASGVAHAQAGDPAAATVSGFNAALGQAMTAGGVQARFHRLEPAVGEAFDIPTMTRVAAGSAWTGLSAADQAALTRAFGRFTAASFAKNFDGEVRFQVDPNVQTRAPDKLVKDQIIPRSGSPTTISFRMRQSGGRWKIVDVYYNGAVSQLASQRADFQSTLGSGGAQALVKKLNDKADTLLRG